SSHRVGAYYKKELLLSEGAGTGGRFNFKANYRVSSWLIPSPISPHCPGLFLSSPVSIRTLRRSLNSTAACARKCTTCGS
ncbi:hypothetical protein ATANTOWER_031994, partial [Ataeniobius toweri]|nr:hypothetical protein [Ataeniobius toweri]